MKRLLLLCLFLCLLTVNVNAAPPVLSSAAIGETLDIKYPPMDVAEQGVPIDLYFHVFNIDGTPCDNSTLICTFHLYNETGGHSIRRNASYNGEEWEIELSLSEQNWLGRHSYVFYCYNDSDGGFVSTFFDVTRNGEHEENKVSVTFLSIIILLPLLFAFLLMFGSTLFDPVEHHILRLFSYLIGVLMVFASIGLSILSLEWYMNVDVVTSYLANFSKIIMWGVVIMIILYWVIYFFYSVFSFKKSKKEY